jgi:uncharacterized protein YbjT (DUF2867 family)
MSDERLIAVAGATGRQGGAVARKLVAAGTWRVRGTSRTPDSAASKALRDLGVEIVRADFDDRASMERALAGAYGAFSVQNSWTAGIEGEIRQGKVAADAAKAAGIQHLVYTSVGGAERNTGIPHFDSKWQIERYIASLGLSATVLRPVWFMDNLNAPDSRSAILNGTLSMALRPQTKLQMIAVEDIGVFAAMAFDRPGEFIGKALELAGDELTMLETAATFSRVLGRRVEFVQMPIERVRRTSEDYATMLEWFERDGYQADIAALRAMHAGLVRFEQWLRKTGWAEAEAPEARKVA